MVQQSVRSNVRIFNSHRLDVRCHNFGYAADDSTLLGSHGGRSRGLFVGLGLLSGGLEPPHEVWNVLLQGND